ncbi:MAG: ABC transporter permease [Planctomycetia bacterium]|nr:ABC transporter permease [Planctomycetia bacterium]
MSWKPIRWKRLFCVWSKWKTGMPARFHRLISVAGRVLRQLRHDRRFLGLSLVVPVVVIYVVKIFVDSFGLTAASPMPSPEALQALLEQQDLPDELRQTVLQTLPPFAPGSRPQTTEPTQIAVPLGAFIVHLITYLLCALVLVRERTAQTLGRMFVSGYRQFEIIGGYVLAYSGLATLQSLLVLIELTFLFKLRLGGGTLVSIYFVIWLLAVTSVALGIFVSNFARTEGQILPFIPMVAVPSILLSGVIISADKLPTWAQWASFLTPLYYANNVIQELLKADGSFVNSWGSLVALPIYGLTVLFLASRTLIATE